MKHGPKSKILMFLTIFFVFFLTLNTSNAQVTFVEVRNQTVDNTLHIKNIEEKLLDLKDNYKLLYDGAKNENDQLGNLISYSGFILSILGIFLAWYINRQHEKIKEMREIIEKTKDYIDKHNLELYKQIKRDETLDLLTRLNEVPEDITNICPLLLSRDLNSADYQKLKNPYLKIKSVAAYTQARYDYLILLMQHFPYESLMDNELSQDIISNINVTSINSMFERDIKGFLVGVFKYLKECRIDNNSSKLLIENLLYFYSKSRHLINVSLSSFLKKEITESGFSFLNIITIAKNKAPNDSLYSNWLDSLSN